MAAPTAVVVPVGSQQAFTCSVTATTDPACTYSIQEGSVGGRIGADGTYTAPSTTGTYHVVATSRADPTKAVVAVVLVTDRAAGQAVVQ